MSKRVNDIDIVEEYVEYGVEYSLNGEVFIHQVDSEEDARFARAVLGGTIVIRRVFETAWAIDASRQSR